MDVYNAIGRRKRSRARVIITPGKGEYSINKHELMDYFKRDTLKTLIEQPLEYLEVMGQYDIKANITGGGLSGQAGALRLGIARALARVNEDFRVKLREKDYLTVDDRKVERKKYGQKKARKRFQFSKR